MVEHKERARSLLFSKNVKIGNTQKENYLLRKYWNASETKTLYGFCIVDIHTPDKSNEKFKDFPLIIKNNPITRKDIGSYIKNVVEEHNLLKKPQ